MTRSRSCDSVGNFQKPLIRLPLPVLAAAQRCRLKRDRSDISRSLARRLVGVNFDEFRQTRKHRRSHWIFGIFEFRHFRRPFSLTPTEPPFRRRDGMTENWTRQGCRRARWYRMNNA